MSYGFSVLIDYEYNRQARIQQFAGALCGGLLNSFEDFLKRNDGNHGSNNFVSVHDGGSYRQSHLLPRANDLRTTDDYSASIHARENVAYALVHLLAFYEINLKG